jgi:hypothetical protein
MNTVLENQRLGDGNGPDSPGRDSVAKSLSAKLTIRTTGGVGVFQSLRRRPLSDHFV